jgi:large subunit ribosomal protein L6
LCQRVPKGLFPSEDAGRLFASTQAAQGISFEVPTGGRSLVVRGIDKELVGEIAARIRRQRPPEPYKGKGVRYRGEQVRRKAGKAGKVGSK